MSASRFQSRRHFPSKSFLSLITQIFFLLWVSAGGESPVLYPDIHLIDAFVEDSGNTVAESFMPVHGSYQWFLCRSDHPSEMQSKRCPDLSKFVIHTSLERVNVILANLNDASMPVPFMRKPNITANVFLDDAVDRVTRYSTEIGSVNISAVGLKPRARVTITAATPTWYGEITIKRDVDRPVIESISGNSTMEAGVGVVVQFLVSMNELVYPVPNGRLCEAKLQSLSESYTADALVRDSRQCSHYFRNISFADVLDLRGETLRLRPTVRAVSIGTSFNLIITATLDASVQDITLKIMSETLMDRAGNLNNVTMSETVYLSKETLQPLDPSMTSSNAQNGQTNALEDSKSVSTRSAGDAFMIMTTSSIVLSMTASMGAFMRHVWSLVMYIVSSSIGREMNNGAMKLLGFSQKLYLTGRLPILAMPKTYHDFTDQFDWALFDNAEMTRRPRTSQDRGKNERSLKIVEGPCILPHGEMCSETEKYRSRLIFWCPLVLLMVILGQMILTLAFFGFKRDIPAFLHFPRLEIMFAYFTAPMAAMAGASLYRTSIAWQAVIATWVLIAFPTSLLCWSIIIIQSEFFKNPLNERRVQMFVEIGEHYEHDSHFLRRAYVFCCGREESSQDTAVFPPIPMEVELGAYQSSPVMELEMVHRSSGPQPSSNAPTHHLTPSLGLGSWHGDEEGETESTSPTSSPTTYTPTTSPTVDTRSLSVSTITAHTASSFKGFHDFCHFIYGFLNSTFLRALLGSRQPRANWVGIGEEGRAFMARYGFIFEDFRGPPVFREEATYEYDEELARVNRGMIVLIDDVNFVQLPWTTGEQFRVYPFHIHLLMKILELVKLILLGCLVGGMDGQLEEASLISLVVLSLFIVAVIRITKPHLNRLDMAIDLIGECVDLMVYVCLCVILQEDHEKTFLDKMGIAMTSTQCVVLASLIIRYAFSAMFVAITGVTQHRTKTMTRFSKTVDQVLRVHFPLYLEHKFFDRWMVKVHHRGLHDRPLRTSELPRSVVAERFLKSIKENVYALVQPRVRNQ